MKIKIRNIEPYFDYGEQHFRLEADIYVDKETFFLVLPAIKDNEIDFREFIRRYNEGVI